MGGYDEVCIFVDQCILNFGGDKYGDLLAINQLPVEFNNQLSVAEQTPHRLFTMANPSPLGPFHLTDPLRLRGPVCYLLKGTESSQEFGSITRRVFGGSILPSIRRGDRLRFSQGRRNCFCWAFWVIQRRRCGIGQAKAPTLL